MSANHENFICEKCNYITINKKDYKKHLLTKKHIDKSNLKKEYKCECGKVYNYNGSLYNHKKKCNIQLSIASNTNKIIDHEKMILTLIDENKELRKALVDQSKLISDVIPKIGNNNNNVNSNNVNKFNINLFLNEQCKDAISMDNFIESIEISLSNLLLSKEKGLAEGISNIFIENINKLPITQRPLHCTDVKRETLYIKNEKWEKDEKKEKTKRAIKRVSKIQASNINHVYIKENPDFMNNDKKKDEYIHIVKATTSDIEGNKEDKIIKNICKEVYINEDSICEKAQD